MGNPMSFIQDATKCPSRSLKRESDSKGSLPWFIWKTIIFNLDKHQQVRLLTVNRFWMKCILRNFYCNVVFCSHKSKFCKPKIFQQSNKHTRNVRIFSVDYVNWEDVGNSFPGMKRLSVENAGISILLDAIHFDDVFLNSWHQLTELSLKIPIPYQQLMNIVSLLDKIQVLQIDMFTFTESRVTSILGVVVTYPLQSFVCKICKLNSDFWQRVSKFTALVSLSVLFDSADEYSIAFQRSENLKRLSLSQIEPKTWICLSLANFCSLEKLRLNIDGKVTCSNVTKSTLKELSLKYIDLNMIEALKPLLYNLEKLQLFTKKIDPTNLTKLLTACLRLKHLKIKDGFRPGMIFIPPDGQLPITHLEVTFREYNIPNLLRWVAINLPDLFSLHLNGKLDCIDISSCLQIPNLIDLSFLHRQDIDSYCETLSMCPNLEMVGLNPLDFKCHRDYLKILYPQLAFYDIRGYQY